MAINVSVESSSSGNNVNSSYSDNRIFIANQITNHFYGKNSHTPINPETITENQKLREFILEVLKTVGFFGITHEVLCGSFTLLRERAFQEAMAFSTFSLTFMYVAKNFDEAQWQRIQR